jgi:hypothetical protein
MKRTLSIVVACLLVLGSSGLAWAEDEYIEQIVQQLTAASAQFLEAGYDVVLWEPGALEPAEVGTYTVRLNEGYTYALVGVCDVDCSDIDLAIFDGNGELVVRDVEDDDVPIIEFTVTSGGDFSLNVGMYECSAEYCYYGVALFRW